MTRKKAFEILDQFPRCVECDDSNFPFHCNECDDAFYKALQELKKQDWIPVTLGLPETDDSYFGRHIIVCDERKQVFPLRYVRRNIRGKTVERWQEEDGRIYGRANIIAWQYLPEAPEEGEQE